ncbi:MAG: hypothetical protein Q7R33_10230 [Nitrosarchaeum sp.]|nr:hypothetical protein [Nitrosarchaeum sp.]
MPTSLSEDKMKCILCDSKDKIENLEKELLKFKDLYIEQTAKLTENEMTKTDVKSEVFDVKGNKLIFEFDNEEALNHFKCWLCEGGEQDYWKWMEYREEEEETENITGVNFDYWAGAKVKVKCSRLDKGE